MLTPLDQPIDKLEDLTESERASDKLFRDAEAEEEAEKQAEARFKKAQRAAEPIWTGDEHIADTVRRMLEDKYKPLRRGDDDMAPPGSGMKQQLNKMGMSAEQLPQEDRKAMGKIRETLRSSAVRDRIKTAVDKSIRYPDRKKGIEPAADEDESENKPLMGVVTAAKGMAGIAEMKIEEALRKGTFKQNSLRGKPIPYDHNEGNAHLHREEFILNRMVQRQNAAPPFVEMNMDMKNEERALRQRIQGAWICRALLSLESSGAWERMEPVVVHWGENDTKATDLPDYTFAIANEGQQVLVDWARDFRDGQWVRDQRKYHEEAVRALNQTIRRYNHIAPYFARRLLYTKDSFVQDALDRAFPVLVEATSARVRGMRAAGTLKPQEEQKTPVADSIWRWFQSKMSS
ncbi:hypothetical protein MOBT1_001816 [Malassezia obtusa]|uniref:DnaJ homologue subfamily C member 28 conserved domain-containing protein n=1 Tax=Malassezia obtusa TaxID=76774 RepID=A0AAF0E0V7_9BASI|nr:hypothetical protein MOBT1_001816 [Malassezia obtusa]